MSATPVSAQGPVLVPFWAGPIFHLATGALVLAAGAVLLHFGQTNEADAAFGSAFTFLGVGAGVAASA